MKSKSIFGIAALVGAGILMSISACNNPDTALQQKVEALENELNVLKAEKALTEQRLLIFDTLDFDFYSNQVWDKFNHSHTDDIKVYYPDGVITEGLYPQHIDMLTPMFVFAPDTKINSHPVKFGSGDWTAVIGEMEGTFSEPLPIGEGKSIPPTGKKFKLRMATIGHWKDGQMIEEYLFWDNQSFMKQIGLAQ
ncbi:MAG: polyketide cyclase [Bacteroidetes bacterium]|nr:MAG: polyketide cyclase [Bacteroidota bacterium]